MVVSLPVLQTVNPGRSAPIPLRGDLPGAPRNPHVHLFDTEQGPHLFVVNGSRVYGLGTEEAEVFSAAVRASDPENVFSLLAASGLAAPLVIDDTPLSSPPLRALSLAVAQKCNLGCTYCYAQEGDFGGAARAMSLDVALAAVERLFAGCPSGERVNLAFLGGEPLLARDVLRAATEHAVRFSRERGVRLGLSITTNGTLITPDDGDYFERHGFAVVVSLDGVGAAHDRQRAFKGGRGTFDRILANVLPLLAGQRRMEVSARVTVTPRNLDLAHTLDALIGLGFHSVGFSPMLASPAGRDQMGTDDLDRMLEQMIACGQAFERRTVAGDRYPFANAVNALKEIHRGTHRPYPCGAGAGYFGVAADGALAACHRFINDAEGAMGDLASGVEPERQTRWLRERHVHHQEPCRSCWARYLCGGGCHHEVIHRGRPACDYIRGWLHYCLGAYVRLLAARPDYFHGQRPNS
jgi:uncharacterized protein